MNPSNEIQLTVFLMNQTRIELSFDKTADQLIANDVLNSVLKYLSERGVGDGRQLSFSQKYKKLLSIWVTSPTLELQLQPKHKPFSILAKWDSLLLKHGPTQLVTDPTLIEKDEPTLSLQRNVFCEQSIEFELSTEDTGALYLLYYEAKLNVLEGRYPSDQFEDLAAYQAAIDSKTTETSKRSVEYFRTHLKEYIPRNQIKAIDGGNRMTGLIRTLSRSSPTAVCAQNIAKKYNELTEGIDEFSPYRLVRSYLEMCWKIPCYASAFFSGQIERPVKSKLDTIMSHYDLQVWVAINQKGLHLVSKEKPELLLSIDISDLCWAVGCPNSSDPNCIPCIFVQIPGEMNEEQQILQIFSRQYKLIESLLNSLIKDKRSSLHIDQTDDINQYESNDVTDGPTERIPQPRIERPLNSEPNNCQIIPRIIRQEKLCLAKFDQSGNYLNKTGTWVRNTRNNQRNRV